MCVVYYSFSFSFRFGTVRFAFAISVYVEVFRLSIVPLLRLHLLYSPLCIFFYFFVVESKISN